MKALLSCLIFLCSSSLLAMSDENPKFLEKLAQGDQYVAGPSSADFLLRSICGEPDFMYVNDYDGSLGVSTEFVQEHKAAVGKMNSVICTGTLIGEDLFLTASHCVGSNTVGEEILFDYEYEKGSNKNLIDYQVYVVEEIIEDGDQHNLDYAVLRLEGKPGLEYGFRQLNKNTIFEADPIAMIQHPRGRPKQIEAGTLHHFNSTQLFYGDLDTEGGSSGSGVLDANGQIVGVHTHGGCYGNSGQNKGTRVEIMAEKSDLINEMATLPEPPLP